MKKTIGFLALVLFVSATASVLEGSIIYPLIPFTENGEYFDEPGLNLYIEVIYLQSAIDFKFHNESSIDSSIARIYLDDNSLLSFEGISEGPGTSFNVPAVPLNLPAAQLLTPPFVMDFSIGADAPLPHNGINPTEWLTIHYNLINGAIVADITNALNDESLRIGVHVIGLPDGSSESAVIPEPTTLLLLGLGGLVLRRKRQKDFGFAYPSPIRLLA